MLDNRCYKSPWRKIHNPANLPLSPIRRKIGANSGGGSFENYLHPDDHKGTESLEQNQIFKPQYLSNPML